MDVTSYLLGKQAGGGSTPALQNKSVTITENGTTNVVADSGYDGLSEVEITTNVSGGGDTSKYFTNSISQGNYTSGTNWYNGVSKMIKEIPADTVVSGTSLKYAFFRCAELVTIPLIDTSNILNFDYCFQGCTKIVEIPALDTSHGSTFPLMFASCSELTTVPVFNWSSATSLSRIFQYCNKLNDTSLDNILQSCISVTSAYTGTKTFYALFDYDYAKTVYPVSRIEALPHYQDFIDAGWTIGY